MSVPENKAPGKNIGLGMLVASFSLTLVALTIIFDTWLSDLYNPNKTPTSTLSESGIKEVTLERNRQGHYVANGEINGIPATFLLDTGATDVAIPADVANRARLEKGNAHQASTANGIVTVFDTLVDELSLGNIVLYDIDASITPSMLGNTVLLGMSALRQVEFAQRGSTLTLTQLPEKLK